MLVNAVFHELPEDRQEVIARAILDYASGDADVYHLTEEERREVRAGYASGGGRLAEAYHTA